MIIISIDFLIYKAYLFIFIYINISNINGKYIINLNITVHKKKFFNCLFCL